MDPARVRMYRQGLGDCFLLTFPGEQRRVHVLVDCGVLVGTGDAAAKMRRVAENVRTETGGALDVLVVTHEHWDHASGFVQAPEVFDRLQVKEVWLAWTENPRDELAGELASGRARALAGLAAASQRLAGMQGAGAARTARRIERVLGFFGGPLEAAKRTISAAMEWAKARPGAAVRFLVPGGEPVPIPGTDRARAYVLGPPRDRALIRKSDPSQRASEVYQLSGEGGPELGFLAATGVGGPGDAGRPFDEWFQVPEQAARSRPFFLDHYGFEGDDWRRVESEWLGSAGPLALKLDSDTNNTSLALAFELLPSRRVLLFPGDAQVGNWLSWEAVRWRVRGAGGEPHTVTAGELLARTVLYKVGHHGSHNATLREKGLELMTSEELTAMLPVERAMAEKQEWNMPFPSLYRRLQERTRGRILDRDQGIERRLLEPMEWTALASRADVEPDWIDYRIEA